MTDWRISEIVYRIAVPVFNALLELPINVIALWIAAKYFKREHDERYIDYSSLPPLILVLIESILGNFGNFMIVFATIKTRNLHNITNVFIALCAFCDLINHFSSYFLAYVKLSGLNMVKRSICWYATLGPNLCLNAGMIMVLWIGIDRLIGVSMPGKYRSINSSIYISIVAISSAGYACVWVILSWRMTMATTTYSWTELKTIRTVDELVSCNVADFIPYSLMDIWGLICIGLSFLIGLVYISIWVIIKMRKSQANAAGRVMKSLTIITIVMLLCFPTSMVLYFISSYIVASEYVNLFCQYVACLQNFGIACNFYIYFIFSQDYRRAFLRILPCCNCLIRSNTVTVITIVPPKSTATSKSIRS